MMRQIKSLVLVMGLIVSYQAFSDTQVLTMNENKRLEAHIALDMMNRLAVANDRIVNVFGDEGTFVTQADENTGQVFIKPTLENGTKLLSITLITENGHTQDLSLVPSVRGASTLVLKNPGAKNEVNHLTGLSHRPQNTQEQMIQIMRQAVLNELPEMTDKPTLKRNEIKGYKLKFETAFQSSGFIVSVWSVKNMSQSVKVLQEKDFYQPQDLALSLEKSFLQPEEKTLLYAIKRI